MQVYKFKPTDDISTKELADIFIVIMNALIQGVAGREWNPAEDLEIEAPIFNVMPPNVRKHFEEREQSTPETD